MPILASPILIVEDDHNTSKLVATYLARKGFTTIAAYDGEEALRQARLCKPGFVILDVIFERFFRADRSRSRDADGAGIGLAITKEPIEAHGGSIGAESSPNDTHIWFILPL